MKKRNLEVADELIEATIHCKTEAAVLLIETLYEQLTNRRQVVTRNINNRHINNSNIVLYYHRVSS